MSTPTKTPPPANPLDRAPLARLEVVFFDAGHTLLEPDPPVEVRYAETARRHGVEASPEAIRARFSRRWLEGQAQRERDLYRTDDDGTRRFWYDFVAGVFEPHQGEFSSYDAFFEELYEAFATPSAWRLFDDVSAGLEALERLGLRLAIISNWDRRLSALVESMGIASAFEAVVTSAEVGYEKPSPAIFERALSTCGVSADRALHVGDSLEADVAGALGAGLSAVLVDRRRDRPVRAAEGHLVVPSIADLVALLTPEGPGAT